MIAAVYYNYLFLLVLFLSAPAAYAIDALQFHIKQLQIQAWQLQNLHLELSQLDQKPQLQLLIQKLILPAPVNELQLVNIRCNSFSWHQQSLDCRHGVGQLNSTQFNSPQFEFSFQISPQNSRLEIQKLKFMQSLLHLQADLHSGQWQLRLNGQSIGLKILHKLLFPQLQLTSGQFDISTNLRGYHRNLNQAHIHLEAYDLSIQTADGSKASENLGLNFDLTARQWHQDWLWEIDSVFNHGNLYFEPLYVENKHTPIRLTAQGYWNSHHQIELNSATFKYPQVGLIKAQGIINTRPFTIETGKIYLTIPQLATASTLYLQPYLRATSFEGISLIGNVETTLTIENQQLVKADVNSSQFNVVDTQKRFDLQGGILSLHWSNQTQPTQSSSLAWKKFNFFQLPLEQSYFSFLVNQQHIQLLRKTRLPLLNGQLIIQQFDWQAIKNHSPKVQFSGQIRHISLKLLSKIFNWKPLTGNINGQIPNVTLIDGKLTLGGELKIALFNGYLVFKKLAISGFMSDFTQFYSDILINHLDLDALTQRFSFGGIQGNISGYIKDLYLENWQPIQFNAWLGTPDNDHSTHKISQKAVENIASIGGGGAIDLISRGILSLFDNFGYEKIGLGCYLHHDICELTGVEAADYGYYMIKGGGLPRIDVMGYNPRIDWKILQERLNRIAASNKAVAK